LFSKMWDRLTSRQGKFKVIMVGLDNAGKTTTLYKLYVQYLSISSPTLMAPVIAIASWMKLS